MSSTSRTPVRLSMSSTSRTPVRLSMSMTLDGFVTGPDDRHGQGLGRGGGRIFDWLDDRHGSGVNGDVYREYLATGALISGRRTYELADRWGGDHHDGVPIHVLTHHPDDVPPGSARYFTDVDRCADEARQASGDKVVMAHGAGVAQALLAARQLDEIEIHLVPVLLGAGRRLSDTNCDSRVRDTLLKWPTSMPVRGSPSR